MYLREHSWSALLASIAAERSCKYYYPPELMLVLALELYERSGER